MSGSERMANSRNSPRYPSFRGLSAPSCRYMASAVMQANIPSNPRVIGQACGLRWQIARVSTPSTRNRIDTSPYSVMACLYSEKMAGGRMAMSTDATTPTEARASSTQKFTSRGNRWRTNMRLQATASGGGM